MSLGIAAADSSNERTRPSRQHMDVTGQGTLAGPALPENENRIAGAGEARTLVQDLRDTDGGSEQQR